MDFQVFRFLSRHLNQPYEVYLRLLKKQFPTLGVSSIAELYQIVDSSEFADSTFLVDIAVLNDDLCFTGCKNRLTRVLSPEEAVPLLEQDESFCRDFNYKVKMLSQQRQQYFRSLTERLARQEEAFCSYSYNPAYSSIIQQQQENDIDTSHIPAEMVYNDLYNKRSQLNIIKQSVDTEYLTRSIIGVIPSIQNEQLRIYLCLRSGQQKIVDISKIAQIRPLAEKVIGFLASALLLQDKNE